MTRSEKIKRFFYGRNLMAKQTAVGYATASLRMLERETVLNANPAGERFLHDLETAIGRYTKIISTLKRQEFVLTHPRIDFDIIRSGDDDWSEPLFVPTDIYKHRLYRIILSDDDEALFILST